MELKTLRYFVTLGEELHFGRAARRLHISQPPLSRQISRLEEEIGAKLFYRTQRHVELTPAGELLMRDASAILANVAEAMNTARRAGRGEVGKLSVGFFLGATYTLLPRILQNFRAQHPEVKLALQEMGITQVLDAIISGEIDVGFLRPPSADPAVLTEVLLREPFLAVVPQNSRFRAARSISLKDLADEPLIMYTPGNSILYTQIMTACHKAGFQPRIVQETRRPITMISLVRAGAGTALVTSSVQVTGSKGVLFKKIRGPLPMTEIAIAWRARNPSPLLQSFLKTARQAKRMRSATA